MAAKQRLHPIIRDGIVAAFAVELYEPDITDRWQVAYVLWVMANTFGPCRLVSVACPDPLPVARQDGFDFGGVA